MKKFVALIFVSMIAISGFSFAAEAAVNSEAPAKCISDWF